MYCRLADALLNLDFVGGLVWVWLVSCACVELLVGLICVRLGGLVLGFVCFGCWLLCCWVCWFTCRVC